MVIGNGRSNLMVTSNGRSTLWLSAMAAATLWSSAMAAATLWPCLRSSHATDNAKAAPHSTTASQVVKLQSPPGSHRPDPYDDESEEEEQQDDYYSSSGVSDLEEHVAALRLEALEK